jgi:acrylyl-CoA reductase (NADPH)
MFKALVLKKEPEFCVGLESLQSVELQDGQVRLGVKYSSLNYKDALAITNTAPVVRSWPMVAGIDGVGVVMESKDPDWAVGEWAIHNGWGMGETSFGLMAQQAVVPGRGLVHLPQSLTALESMAIGTAGYTAMLCVMALERHGVAPSCGEVLVTGASGGVGSMSVALLSSLGYAVVASSGKSEEHDFLRDLGAKEVIDRALLSEAGKPLQKERFAGVIDSVGSNTLANALAQTKYAGVVAACGLAQGADLPSTVMPFILRSVSLVGIDSVMAPIALRQEAWTRLAKDLDLAKLKRITQVVSLQGAVQKAQALRQGLLKGRWVVEVSE